MHWIQVLFGQFKHRVVLQTWHSLVVKFKKKKLEQAKQDDVLQTWQPAGHLIQLAGIELERVKPSKQVRQVIPSPHSRQFGI